MPDLQSVKTIKRIREDMDLLAVGHLYDLLDSVQNLISIREDSIKQAKEMSIKRKKNEN